VSISEQLTELAQSTEETTEETGRPAWHLVHWVGPHVAIWATVTATIWFSAGRADCTGFCAVYSGVFGYLLLTVAAVLSALIGIVQILFLTHFTDGRFVEN
jgi:hypothetical protein